MSKERLEEISKNATGIMNMDSGTVDSIDLSIIDFTWLFQFAKEQSERVQKLETDYVILGVEQEEEIMSELESLRQQVKRYREAIEKAKNAMCLVVGGEGSATKVAHDILRKALED